MVFQTDAGLKAAYAEQLKQAGQIVSVDQPVGDQGGTIDILTDREIIFCTLSLNQASAFLLKSQLDFYSRFSPSWQKVVVVQEIVETAAATFLTAAGIRIVELSREPPQPPVKATSVDPIEEPPVSFDRESIYSYPALKSVAGGEGLRIAMIVIAAIIFVGFCGFVISLLRSQEQQSSRLPPSTVRWPAALAKGVGNSKLQHVGSDVEIC